MSRCYEHFDVSGTEIVENLSDVWGSLVKYVGRKEPIIASILNGSKIEVIDNKVNVKIVSKLKYMLEARKMDAFFKRIFKNLYNKNYIVSFECAESADFEEKYQNMQRLQEKVIVDEIEKANSEKAKFLEEHPEFKNEENLLLFDKDEILFECLKYLLKSNAAVNRGYVLEGIPVNMEQEMDGEDVIVTLRIKNQKKPKGGISKPLFK